MKQKLSGLSLVEILVACSIIAIVTAVMVPNMVGARRNALSRVTQAYGGNVYMAVNGFMAIHPHVTAQALVADTFSPINLSTKKFPLASGSSYYPNSNVRSCSEGYTLDYANGTLSVTRTGAVDNSRSFSWPVADSKVSCAIVAYADTAGGSTNAYAIAVYTWDTMNPSKVYLNGKVL